MDLQMQSESHMQQLVPLPSKNVLEYLLNEKIGYGKAQEKLALSIYVLLFTQGCQSIVLGLLLPELQQQWKISTFQKSMLICMVYFGVTIGSFIQTYSDKYGRAPFITWNTVLQTIFGFMSCIASSMPQFIVYRFLYGVGIGITFPISASYISQICPEAQRGSVLVKSRLYWAAGMFFTCLLSWILLQTHRWRILLFIICLPGIYALIEHLRVGRETLRYLWVTKQKKQIVELVNFMTELNQKQKVSQNQLQMLMDHQFLIQSQKQGQNVQQQNSKQFLYMFSDKYRKITIIFMISWFSICFTYYAVMIFLPSILARSTTMSYNFKYSFLMITTFIQSMGLVLSPYFMEHKFFGRKRSIYISMYIIAIVFLSIILIGQNSSVALLVLFSLIRFMMTLGFMIIYPYTTQVYETLMRGKAMGFFSICGRIATIILGITGASALLWFNGQGLYIICFALSLAAAFGISQMPYCTLGRPMQ